MSAQPIKTVNLGDTVDDVQRFIRYLLTRLRLLLILLAAGIALALAYYWIQKPAYEANVSFILEEKSSGMGGGLSGLASQFGIDIGSLTGGSSGLFAGDNILDILKSRLIVEKVLLTKIDSSKGANSPTLADRYLDFSHLKSKWSGQDPAWETFSFSNIKPGQPHSLLQDSVLFVIYEKMVKKNLVADRLNKKGSIIQISVTSRDAIFSKCFSERLLEETKNLYIGIKTSVSAANVARLEKRADSLLGVMNARSYQAASQQILDANPAFKANAVPSEASQRDKMVAYAIYTEVMKNLEASRMALANQTPVIQLLDEAKYPLENQAKPLWLLLLIGLVGGFALGLLITFYQYR